MIRVVAATFVVAATVAAPAAAQPSARLIAATPVAGAPAGARAVVIRYRTTAATGTMREATALVIVPAGPAPAGGRAIVAWTHGTTGIADACAPSANAWKFSIIAGLDAMLARGYVVVAPDYAGLGTPGPHPFLAGPDTARAVLDAVRAAAAVPGAAAGTRFAVWGESQGGHAALWTGQLARTYAPDLTLVGVAAAAPATDLVANIAGAKNAAVRALLTTYAAVAWSAVYHVPLATIARPAGADLMRRVATNCVTLDGFRLGTKIGLARMTYVLKNVDLAAHPRWGPLMRANSVPATPLGVPLFVAQGSGDQIIDPKVTRRFVSRLCAARQPVRFMTDGGDHVTVATRTAAATIDWIADRFSGRPPPNDCPIGA